MMMRLLGSPDGAGFWLPKEASASAPGVDWVFAFIFWICLVFFVLITVLTVIFVVRYRRRPGREEGEATAHHNLVLELTWSGIPTVLVILIFVFGFKAYLDLATPPRDAYEIQVTAQKWKWAFTYPNGYVDDTLHVPLGKPVRLVMSSVDVIHSLYVPAFRIKRDVVPGRYATAWFEATKEGEFPLFCAEYCGTGHSSMLSTVVVDASERFDRWLEEASDFLKTMPPAEAGRKLYQVRGCAQCHSVDGTVNVGPSFKGLFGHVQVLASGERVTVDENYIRESILEPSAKVVAGFEPVMPTFQGRLKDEEISAIISYIKSLEKGE